MWIRIKSRWNTMAQAEAIRLGIPSQPELYELKPIIVNTNRIAFIENYQGFCYVAFSNLDNDGIVTDIPYSKNGIQRVFGEIKQF